MVTKHINAVTAAEIISCELNIPLATLVDAFAKIPPVVVDEELEKIRLLHTRLTRYARTLEDECSRLRGRLSVYEPEETVSINTLSYKRKFAQVTNRCIYGEAYFCDGTPNRSVKDGDRLAHKKPCPNYTFCPIRQNSIGGE